MSVSCHLDRASNDEFGVECLFWFLTFDALSKWHDPDIRLEFKKKSPLKTFCFPSICSGTKYISSACFACCANKVFFRFNFVGSIFTGAWTLFTLGFYPQMDKDNIYMTSEKRVHININTVGYNGACMVHHFYIWFPLTAFSSHKLTYLPLQSLSQGQCHNLDGQLHHFDKQHHLYHIQ